MNKEVRVNSDSKQINQIDASDNPHRKVEKTSTAGHRVISLEKMKCKLQETNRGMKEQTASVC